MKNRKLMKKRKLEAEASPQQRALAMDEILLVIYGFALGNDLNSIIEDTSISCVSTGFSRCFVPYLSSAPLRLAYEGARDAAPPEGRIVEWLKRHGIASLAELKISIRGDFDHLDIRRCIDDFEGADVSNLKSFDLSVISSKVGLMDVISHSPERTRDVENLLDLFAAANFLTNLKVNDCVDTPASVYQNFLLGFTHLKSLDASVCSPRNITENIPNMGKHLPHLETLVLHGVHEEFSFSSESLKTLDLSHCCVYFRAIAHLDCPSLTSLRITSRFSGPIEIAGVTDLSLIEEFGNFNRDFITNYWETNEHQVSSDLVRRITSISIVPSSRIVSDSFRVGEGCFIVLYNLGF